MENQPAQEVLDQPAKPQSKSTVCLVILLVLILVAALSALGVAIYIVKSLPKLGPPGAEGQPTSQPAEATKEASEQSLPEEEEVSQPKVGVASGKIFVVKTENLNDTIYSYDINTKEIKTWKSAFPGVADPANPKGSITGIKVIDGDQLGFGRCDTKTGDFNCGVYVLDLKTNSLTMKRDLGVEDFLGPIDFYDEDNFAYMLENDDAWKFVYDTKGNQTILESTIATPYGRGGFREDSEKVRFSPDGKSVFYIATSSPKAVVDFHIYLFDLAQGKLTDTVEDATQPEWLSNTEIIYRNPKEGSLGLYVYDLIKKSSAKVTSASTNAYNPRVAKSTKLAVYEMYPDKKVQLFDATKNTGSLLLSQALSPIWVTKEIIAYEEVDPCPIGGCEEGYGGEEMLTTKVALYNITTKQKLGYVSDLTNTWQMVSLFGN